MSAGVKFAIIGFSFGMLIISLLIGLWAKRKVKSAKEYFGSTGLFYYIKYNIKTKTQNFKLWKKKIKKRNF